MLADNGFFSEANVNACERKHPPRAALRVG